MSRETDTPSSGPNGRGGGAAYPSGTPPYGTPAASDAGSDKGRSAERPEERKTETTLTTRIRINIPGSRPIPPVVVRTPVADAGTSEETGETELPTAAPGAATATVDAPADPAQSAEDKTSDWFAPRKSGPAKGGPGSGATNGAGLPGGSAAGTPGAGAPGAASGGARPGAGASGGARPGGVVGSMSVPGGSRAGGANGRPGGTNGAGLPGATGGPVAPGHGGGTGSFDVTEALAAGPLGNGGPRAGGEPRRDELPYFSDNDPAQQNGHPDQNGFADPGGQNGQGGFGGPGGQNGQGGFAGQDGLSGQSGYGGQDSLNGQNGYGGPGTQNGFAGPAQDNGFGGPGGDPFASPGGPGADNFAGPGGASGFNGPNGRGGQGGQGGSQGPAGPTGGPVTGDGPLVPPLGPGGPGALPGGESFGPGGPGGPGGPRTARGGAPAGLGMAPGAPGSAAPGTGTGRGPGGGLSDDTAILTPQKPAPEPGTPGYPTPDNVSGHTVTSGIPVVPPGAKSPFGPGGSTDGPLPHTPPKLPEPVAQNVPAAAAPKKKKKGRSKLVLLAGVVVVAGVGVYGAGLLMNHSDVPKGTTVLGVDIGGGTRDDAVKKLDAAFGSRVNKPLKLSVGGSTVPLTPDQAGLQFDEQATVAKAATSDYNPVSVVGSLFGQHRVIDPVMPVDEEKLAAALKSAAGGGSGSVTDGTIEFKSGKAVAVYGKGGKGIDAAKSAQAVEEAYRSQVESGTTAPVAVVTTGQQPTVSNAEVDREMKAFAQPAMSANVIVKTDTGKQIEFSPQNSLWKFLRVKAVGGKLVDSPDLNALKELYGQTFDGVLITRGTGQKTAVTPQDVYVALRQALLSKTNRVGIIQTNPS
ncbi:hypothetical protein ABZZ74_06190 [Streptomyces sp. NPDC006476]|uniref:hypothetical protein n=1 Tax=Streptomyces sp. NPDC006476 TaxID=3157175 RepID=UPI0033AF1B5F